MIRRPRPTRLLAMLAALLCTVLALAAGAAQAGAAPYVKSPTLSVSSTNPCRESTLTAQGQNFTPGSKVTIKIGSQVLGTVTAGGTSRSTNSFAAAASGTFSLAVRLPAGTAGRVTVVAYGGSNANTASTQLDINGSCTSAAGAGSGSGSGTGNSASGSGSGAASGGLSSTGVAVLGMLVVALGLLGAGFVLVIGGRRRKATA